MYNMSIRLIYENVCKEVIIRTAGDVMSLIQYLRSQARGYVDTDPAHLIVCAGD